MDLLTLKQASKWASEYLKKDITTSNISYLINYGKVQKAAENGTVYIYKNELKEYLDKRNDAKKRSWDKKLGKDLNWVLSFEQYKESETTKHVHRLHPYKGKFIPQLVEYFLDSHKDQFKKETFFKEDDIILDPFCGSGTTLVQANELGMHAVGIDISEFNTLISNVKIKKYDLTDIQNEVTRISNLLNKFLLSSRVIEFDKKLTTELARINNLHFTPGKYRYNINEGKIHEEQYSQVFIKEAMKLYQDLIKRYGINLKLKNTDRFLDKWYIQPVRDELQLVFDEIKKAKNIDTKKILTIILSRTIRSCRATTHSDLATLKEPIISIYYCTKHNKICKPLFSIKKMWDRYTKDTISRLHQFNNYRTNTNQICITGDSQNVDIIDAVRKNLPEFANLISTRKFSGIFSSPPYVGLIDYHEQHAYAYDLFGFKRRDELEIGPLQKGQGKQARDNYIESIVNVLNNCKKYLKKDFDVFLVANDKYNLYPSISEKAGIKIVNQYKRPVLNRTEKDKGAYSEIIFHMKENS